MQRVKCTPIGCDHPCFCSGACMGQTPANTAWVYAVEKPVFSDDNIILVDGIYYHISKEEKKEETT